MMQGPPGYGPPGQPQGAWGQQNGWGQQGQAMVPQGQQGLIPAGLLHSSLTVKRPFWSLLGRKFHVFSPDGALVAFVKHPLLKLKMEFTIFADEGETMPLLTIRARQLIGVNMCFDVFDAQSGQKVGTLRRRGLKSIIRDTWDILDHNDQPVGLVEEEGAAFLRRLFPLLLGKWKIELGGALVGNIRQVFRFFVKEFTLDLSMNQGRLDPRFAVACAIFALMAESARERG